MGFRFWRRVRLAPGVTLNLSKSGASLSLGPRGAKVTIGGRGRRATVGVPGSGLFYSVHSPSRSSSRASSRSSSQEAPAVANRLSLGFFERLLAPPGKRAFVDGLKALGAGDEERALAHFEAAGETADGAWFAGLLRLKRRQFEAAERHLRFALAHVRDLGATARELGVEATATLAITPEVMAHIGADERGTLLALAELYQLTDRADDARAVLERLYGLDPDDPVVRLSLAELVLDAGDEAAAKRVLALTDGVDNEGPIEAALLLYRGRALARLGLDEAAARTFTAALRRRKNRPPELLHELRYQRALANQRRGHKAAARRDLERLYADAPDYADVARRLGLGA